MSTLSKVQLAAACVAALGFSCSGAVNANPTVAQKHAPSVKIAQADSTTKTEKTEKPKKEKASSKKAASKGKESSCKGKEGSCKGKEGSCKGKDEAK